MSGDRSVLNKLVVQESSILLFDLLEPDDADLVRDVAAEQGFEQYGDTGERFEPVS